MKMCWLVVVELCVVSPADGLCRWREQEEGEFVADDAEALGSAHVHNLLQRVKHLQLPITITITITAAHLQA